MTAGGSKFPPLIPDRPNNRSGSQPMEQQESIHALGSGGQSLVLEDSGTLHAKNALKLRQNIAAFDEQISQVKRGLHRERQRRSTFGGAAASKQSKRREMCKLNQLESLIMRYTLRSNDFGAKNDVLRAKINQQRIEMTALKRVFNERCEDLNVSKENIKNIMLQANTIEKQRLASKDKLAHVLDTYNNENEQLELNMSNASSYIESANERAMERIDQVLKMGNKKHREQQQQQEQQEQQERQKQSKSKKKARQNGGSTFLTGGNDEDEEDGSRGSSGWKPNTTSGASDPNNYIEVHSEKEYKTAFDTIGQGMGGLTDPQDIVHTFLSNESGLFEHFRNCERVHEQIKIHKSDIRSIKSKYEQMTNDATKANAATKAKMDQLQERISRTQAKDKVQKRTLRKIKKNFDQIALRMSEMFSVLVRNFEQVGCVSLRSVSSNFCCVSLALPF